MPSFLVGAKLLLGRAVYTWLAVLMDVPSSEAPLMSQRKVEAVALSF